MNYSVTGEQLTGIADAIRAKTGSSGGLEFPTDFINGIASIVSTSSLESDVVTKTETRNPSGLLQPGKCYSTSFLFRRPSGVLLNQIIAVDSVSCDHSDLECCISGSKIVSQFPSNRNTMPVYFDVYNKTDTYLSIPSITFTVTLRYLKVQS